MNLLSYIYFMPILAFLGAGAMAEALARGLVASELYSPAEIALFCPSQTRARALADSIGARYAASPLQAVEGASAIILAMKPHQIESALEPLRAGITSEQLIISVAAGVSTARLQACFENPVPIVRAMPNTPALIGAAATAICRGPHADSENLATARSIFEAVGVCVEADEKLFDAVTGLSGSGPAYVFNFIEALADGGVRAGLSRAVALKLAAQTVMGAAQMVLETGEHPGVLKDRVASPGGTTIAGVHELERGGFRGIVMDAVMAASERSKEMG